MSKLTAGIIAGLLALAVAITALICLERIPAGYVGVVYSMNGGIQDELLYIETSGRNRRSGRSIRRTD